MDDLRSERIYLRPIRLTDAEDIYSYRSDPEIYPYQSWRPKTMQQVEEFIRHQTVREPNIPNSWFQLAICLAESNELIGDCGLHFLETIHQSVEVGITLMRRYQGRGYAAETLKIVFNYVFIELKKHRIIASVDPENIASLQLCERMKMRNEAHFMESIWFKDRWVDDVVYGILDREWKTDLD